MGTASSLPPPSPPSSLSSSSTSVVPKRATTYSAASAISSSVGFPLFPFRPNIFFPDSASAKSASDDCRHSFRMSVRPSEVYVLSRRRRWRSWLSAAPSSSASPPHCLRSCPSRRSGMCWPRVKQEVTERHFSRSICPTSVCRPVCSVVFSFTSEKASTIIASRKLSSTMKTRSSKDQKKRVPARPCRPVRLRSSAFTPISPSRISKQVSTEEPKEEKAWMLLPKMRCAIMA
mmetsp:Transcript_27128/g.48351  ORF Transcript_27128/g.48351 Transcript_27128/m.48351 type:complete len:232 (+) Transcript_27128:578-1273(+)